MEVRRHSLVQAFAKKLNLSKALVWARDKLKGS
jgi:hypothetical protein